MPPPRDLKYLLGDVRGHTSRFLQGGSDALDGFVDLVNLLLGVTVLDESVAGVRPHRGPEPHTFVLSGWRRIRDPILLTDGNYLRLIMTLYFQKTEEGRRLKVDAANYQYQTDLEGKQWIFRYDYRRNPDDQYAAAHVQVRGTLTETTSVSTLHKVHFPTNRVSLEAVLRLLIEDFSVPPREPTDNWRAVLAASETEFLKYAHLPLSGPGGAKKEPDAAE